MQIMAILPFSFSQAKTKGLNPMNMLLSQIMLDKSFYEKKPIKLAKDLLGKTLIHETEDGAVGGVIVETEAYCGIDDPASHAANGPTPRSKIMFGEPGVSYIYFSYGMHNLFNVVANRDGVAGAVLVRALEPVIGIDLMKKWRNTPKLANLCSGPGKLAAALGITLKQNGISLLGKPLYIANRPFRRFEVQSSARIGISKAVERPWRFTIKDSQFVSVRPTEGRKLAVK